MEYLQNGNFYICFLDFGDVEDLIEEYQEINMGDYYSGIKINGWLSSNHLSEDVYQVYNLTKDYLAVNQNGNRFINLNMKDAKIKDVKFKTEVNMLREITLLSKYC